MYRKVIFETADEFFEACTSDSVPDTVYVVFDDRAVPRLSGAGSEKFGLTGITQSDFIAAAFRIANSEVQIT